MLSTEDNELLTRTGPGTPMGELFRRFWLPALLPSELPEPDCPPVRFRILGEDLVGFRDTGGRLGFLAAACPHRRVSLFFGRNEEHGLRCAYHGWKFDVDGRCIDMPNEPAVSSFKGKVQTRAYLGCEWGGLIWIYMGPRDRRPELPQYDWCLPPEDPNKQIWKWSQDSNYAQGLEGNIDSSHVSFLHRWFGKMPDYLGDAAPKLIPLETEFGFVYGARRGNGQPFHWRVTPFVLPLYTVIPNRTGKGAGFFVVPMDDEHSWWFTVQRTQPVDFGPSRSRYVDLIPGSFRQTRNRDNDYLIDREMQWTVNFTGLPTNRVQDAAVTESMGAVVDRTVEHLGASDVAIIFMRRLLLRLARQLQEGVEPAILTHPEWHLVLPLDVDSTEPDLAKLWRDESPRVLAAM